VLLKSSDRVFLVGVTGQGKSHLLKSLLRTFSAQGIKIMLYDDEAEHDDLEGLPGLTRYVPFGIGNLEEFEEICRTVWRGGNQVFAIENIDFYAPVRKDLLPIFAHLVGRGRKRGIGLVLTSRRIQDVHKTPCSQCQHWFIFHTYLPGDIEYMVKFVGETALKAKDLRPWYFIHWERGTATLHSPIGGTGIV